MQPVSLHYCSLTILPFYANALPLSSDPEHRCPLAGAVMGGTILFIVDPVYVLAGGTSSGITSQTSKTFCIIYWCMRDLNSQAVAAFFTGGTSNESALTQLLQTA